MFRMSLAARSMKATRPLVVAMDFDGTLFNHGIKGMCPEAVQLLHDLKGGEAPSSGDRTRKEEGDDSSSSPRILRVVNTGRNYHALKKALPTDAPIDYTITGSGAYASKWPCGTPVFAHTLEPSVVEVLSQLFMEDLGMPFFLLSKPPTSEHLYAFKGKDLGAVTSQLKSDQGLKSAGTTLNSNFQAKLQMYERTTNELTTKDQLKVVPPTLSGNSEESLYAQFLLMLEDVAEYESVKELVLTKLEEKLGGGSAGSPWCKVIRTTSPMDSKMVWLEIVSPKVGKGDSLKLFTKTVLGKECNDVSRVSCGNDYNDLELLHWAETACLVGDTNPDFLAKLRRWHPKQQQQLKNEHEDAVINATDQSVLRLLKERTFLDPSRSPDKEAKEELLSSTTSDDILYVTEGTSSSGGVAEAIRWHLASEKTPSPSTTTIPHL